MPDVIMIEPNRPQFFGPFIAGDVPAPNPITSPLVLTEPGIYGLRFPAEVATLTIEQWSGGAGGMGQATTGTVPNDGGGGSGYTKVTLGAPLYVSGGVVSVTVGAAGVGGDDAAGGTGGLSKVVCKGTTVASCAGPIGGAGGVASVTVAAGITSVSKINGNDHSPGPGGYGGDGGAAAGTGGGAGGTGGPPGDPGADGKAPGGGGGGSGAAGTLGGDGGGGKVVITW